MTSPESGSRTCPQCGGVNYGTLRTCILCGAPMPAATNPPVAVAGTFCGECGVAVEPGVHFCGECGAPVSAEVQARTRPTTAIAPGPVPKLPVTPPPVIEAPPSRPPTPQATTPISRPCPNCGTILTPGKQFCRKCGFNVTTGELPPLPTPKRVPAAPPPPVAIAPTPAPAPAYAPAGPKPKSRVVKGVLGVVVPVASALATYYLSNRLLGPFFAKQFGPSGQQVGSILCSTLVGGIARQIMR